MKITEALVSIKYVADSQGKKTDVIVPVEVWEALLVSWKQLVEQVEDQEDIGIYQEWLQKRAAGGVETISLDALEQELIADGLV
ncbi:MAG TPA: hypothetical protein DDZ80_27355 [Cyanobacteria bacterium UBA8803]|nr:hypothetical protein [Cyanobacteria bacterium UBA9273]HBL61991.1 hypothetical protein [Cyanobacteria bacterium UBA8803]